MIEEVIVNNNYRGKQLGKILIATLVEVGRVLGCSEVVLNCKDPMIGFYHKYGFSRDSDIMMLRIPHEQVWSETHLFIWLLFDDGYIASRS